MRTRQAQQRESACRQPLRQALSLCAETVEMRHCHRCGRPRPLWWLRTDWLCAAMSRSLAPGQQLCPSGLCPAGVSGARTPFSRRKGWLHSGSASRRRAALPTCASAISASGMPGKILCQGWENSPEPWKRGCRPMCGPYARFVGSMAWIPCLSLPSSIMSRALIQTRKVPPDQVASCRLPCRQLAFCMLIPGTRTQA